MEKHKDKQKDVLLSYLMTRRYIWVYLMVYPYPGSQREMKRDSGRFFMVLKMTCDLLSTDNKVHGVPKDNLNTLAPGRKLYSIHYIV